MHFYIFFQTLVEIDIPNRMSVATRITFAQETDVKLELIQSFVFKLFVCRSQYVNTIALFLEV